MLREKLRHSALGQGESQVWYLEMANLLAPPPRPTPKFMLGRWGDGQLDLTLDFSLDRCLRWLECGVGVPGGCQAVPALDE